MLLLGQIPDIYMFISLLSHQRRQHKNCCKPGQNPERSEPLRLATLQHVHNHNAELCVFRCLSLSAVNMER